mgnify:CR=1 FL=1
MGVLPPFPNFPLFLFFYSTLRQPEYRVTLSCWESGLLSSPISLFHFPSRSGTLPFPLKALSESADSGWGLGRSGFQEPETELETGVLAPTTWCGLAILPSSINPEGVGGGGGGLERCGEMPRIGDQAL